MTAEGIMRLGSQKAGGNEYVLDFFLLLIALLGLGDVRLSAGALNALCAISKNALRRR